MPEAAHANIDLNPTVKLAFSVVTDDLTGEQGTGLYILVASESIAVKVCPLE